MHKSLLTACLLLTTITNSPAQETLTVSGQIKDAADGEALPGVNVVVTTLQVGTTTNAYGHYSLRLPAGAHEISFSFIGYESIVRTTDPHQDQVLNIEMRAAVIELGQIAVSAHQADEHVESIEMSAAELDIQTVQRTPAVLGEADVVQTIQLLPGVTTVREGAAGFNVRGGATDQNLVLLDEAIVYNAAHLFGFFSVFNADITKDIKIYKGGIPAQYGGRLSSVLDVRQKEGNAKEFRGKAGIGILSGRLLLEGPVANGRGSYVIAARRSYGDIFYNAFSSDKSTAHFYDVNFKGNYNINDNNRLFISGYRGRDAFKVADIFGNAWGNTTATIRWNLFSRRLFANFTGVFGRYSYDSDTFTAGAEHNWLSHITNYKLKADFSYSLSEGNAVNFGASTIHYSFIPGTIKPIGKASSVVPTELDQQNAIEPGAYLSLDHQLTDFISLQYGLRLSAFRRQGAQDLPAYRDNQPIVYNGTLGRYEAGVVNSVISFGERENIQSFAGLEPRASARWALTESSSIKVSYNRIRQYIHLISNTTASQPLDIWRPSGPFVEPQTADQIAAGYFRNLQDNTYEASIEAYYKKMNNQIDYVDGADLTVNNNLETELLKGEGRSYGVELMVRKRTGQLTGWLGYTWSRTERQVPGLGNGDPGINNGRYYPASNDKTHDLTLTTVYALKPRWSLSTNLVLATGTPSTLPASRYEFANFIVPQYETRHGARLPAYHRLDLGLTYTTANENSWVFTIYNVYNRRNSASVRVRQNENDKLVTEAVQMSLFGILPSITYNRGF